MRAPDGRADRLGLLFQVPRHRPVAAAAADVEDEVPEHRLAVLGVVDLGVILEAVAAPVLVGDRREAVRRSVMVVRHADFAEAVADGDHGVLVAHPDRLVARETGKHRRLGRDLEPRGAVLAPAVLDPAAVPLRDLLVAETESQDGHGQVEDRGVESSLVARGQRRAPGEDDALDSVEGLDRIVRLPDLRPARTGGGPSLR